jgi:hypothetical protein
VVKQCCLKKQSKSVELAVTWNLSRQSPADGGINHRVHFGWGGSRSPVKRRDSSPFWGASLKGQPKWPPFFISVSLGLLHLTGFIMLNIYRNRAS